MANTVRVAFGFEIKPQEYPMRLLSIAVVLLITCCVCQAQETTASTAGPTSLADAYKQVSEGGAVLLDVRSLKEWNKGHFKAAKHIPIKDLTGMNSIEGLSKEKTIYVHCAKGGRATQGAAHLNSLGFKAEALKTSYSSIRDAGFKEAPAAE
jgi:rhodanese-related sulfurtransferase